MEQFFANMGWERGSGATYGGGRGSGSEGVISKVFVSLRKSLSTGM